MTPGFHWGEGFGFCVLGWHWLLGCLLNIFFQPIIPATHQVLHLRISTAHSPQPTGLYGSDRHSIGLLPKRFISKQSPCGCVLRIVELTLIRSELSSLDMPKPGMTYTFRG